MRQMDFDIQLLLDYFIPDSPSDIGAFLFWALLTILVVIIIIDIRLYRQVRKTTHNTTKPIPDHPTEEQIKILQEKPTTDINEIRKKVDKLIQTNKL